MTGKSVAISKELAGFDGYDVGDEIAVTFTDGTTDRLRVVAIVKTAFEVSPSMLIPIDLARQHAPKAQPAC